MYTLYSDQRSGNSYKVRLALARLGVPYKLVEVDILQGESRTPEFPTKNPNGHVPLLEAAHDRYLSELNAILWYVAGGATLALGQPPQSPGSGSGAVGRGFRCRFIAGRWVSLHAQLALATTAHGVGAARSRPRAVTGREIPTPGRQAGRPVGPRPAHLGPYLTYP